MMMQHWGGSSDVLFGWLLMIGFAAAMFVLLFWLIQLTTLARTGRGDARHSQDAFPSALELLQARYARGELSKEEYLDMRSTLQAHAESLPVRSIE